MRITDTELNFDKLVRVGHQRACDDLAKKRPEDLDPGNPNHPDNDLKLFGYGVSDFLAKQYKPAA